MTQRASRIAGEAGVEAEHPLRLPHRADVVGRASELERLLSVQHRGRARTAPDVQRLQRLVHPPEQPWFPEPFRDLERQLTCALGARTVSHIHHSGAASEMERCLGRLVAGAQRSGQTAIVVRECDEELTTAEPGKPLAALERRHASVGPARLGHRDRALEERDRPCVIAEPMLRAPQRLEDCLACGGVVRRLEQRERGRQRLRRLAVRSARDRALARRHQELDRPSGSRRRFGPTEVDRDLLRVIHRGRTVHILERIGDPRMHRGGARAAELGIQHLLQHRVREAVDRVDGRLHLLDDPLATQVVDRREQRVGGEIGDPLEQRMRHPRTDDRGHLHHLLRRLRKQVVAQRERIADAVGKRELFGRPAHPTLALAPQPPRVHECLERLFYEEGISARPRLHAIGELLDRRRRLAEALGDHLGRLLPSERRKDVPREHVERGEGLFQ